MRLPLELVRTGADRTPRSGETENVSSRGVLFRSEGSAEVGDLIEYVITLPAVQEGTPVRVLCKGKVTRLKASGDGSALRTIAATVERYEFIRVAAASAA